MPKIAYNGQKLRKLVNKKTIPKINTIIPMVPVIVCVKYEMAQMTAANHLIMRSIVPTLYFIKLFLFKL